MSEPLPSFCVKQFLTTYLTTTGFGAHGGSGDESSKEVTIQYYAAIQCYCRSGNRSKQASEKLVKLGYTNIIEIGGIKATPHNGARRLGERF